MRCILAWTENNATQLIATMSANLRMTVKETEISYRCLE